ncbi:MAG: UMP kinase [Rhodospirillaceae bacterium]|nr:UMP kinase [Rhodospirillaceae bacterium]|tara:strand:+ start:1448 stop:2170 length:723 start_codon:yes stop_codon:yes gene_type:complete
MSSALKFRRILLKVSGESLMGNAPYGIDPGTVKRIAQDILEIHQKGIEISIVVGGGNIYRGISGAAAGMERASADYIGMLATVMNALAMQHALEEIGVTTRVLSAIPMETICEPYIRRRAVRHMERERLVIFAAGTGNPYFTTDTAAALRAAEMGCDALFKATKVDGVYSSDPEANPDAKKFKNLKYLDVLSKDLKVMDASAISLARENNIPIVVFSILEMGGLGRIFNGEGDFTLINDG